MFCCSLLIRYPTPASFPSSCAKYSTFTSSPPTNVNSFKRSPRFSKPVSPYRYSSPPIPRIGVRAKLAVDDGGSVGHFLPVHSAANFIRYNEGGADESVVGELQTSVVTYRKKFPSSLQVDLVSTTHAADREYYATLQKKLGTYDCVLYEMVTARSNLEEMQNPSGLKKLKSSVSMRFDISGHIQMLARQLMLDFQSDCLDYLAEGWYHADLDSETLELLQLQKNESVSTFERKLSRKPVVEELDVETLFKFGFSAFLKVLIARELLCNVVTTGLEETVIIGERNKASMEALQRGIDAGHKNIAILYGSSHMPDLGRWLRERFDLTPTRVQWLTAWSIKKSNLANDVRLFVALMLVFASIIALIILVFRLVFGPVVAFISILVSGDY